ncbi:endo-1,3(4)-beta-glucanase [Capronia epimyces CBS 606.96]|uniref:endo-1,3(4)-beta-glucanase n=1 Tax=Capronia epimyces CBS 606.96 TaxID=1182542 RepID=W9YS79_9EURO|nr:endo-1,3(4)-beta-glucanase [Capronia epimyces CBS 606.96]EXJ92121.1 endo-1,3(4)-beta-glucanase [Capronia epimyces CBS 606.96]
MRVSIPTLALLAATTATASYVLEDDYSSSSFASMFDFYTGADPTNGYVNYITQDEAQSSGLYKIDNGAVYMGVDSTNVASGSGRDSIRISSKKSYNHGLIILDLAHMPAGACGTWPAFWLLGPDWPYSGEIDIIEGVNSQTTNNMAMHTDSGCSITNTGAFSGSLETANCDVNAADQATNAGCSIRSGDSSSFGSGFNSDNGGVYATEWTSEAISIWFFPRGGIPADISSGNPDPSGWGLPQGQFTGGCDIDDKVKNQQLVFDVTFCGDWAGNVWSTDATCSSQGSTCQAFVQNNPSAFQDTYWLINSLKVYTANGAATQTTGQSTTAAVTSGNAGSTANPTSEATTPISSTLQTAYTTTAVVTTAPVETATTPATTAPAVTATQASAVTGSWGNSGSWNTAGGSGWGQGSSGWSGWTGRGGGGGRPWGRRWF